MSVLKRALNSIWAFVRHRTSITISFAMVASILVFSFVLANFAPYDPRRWGVVPRNLPPNNKFVFGTTSVGQDVFWLLTYSVRNSVVLGVVGSVVGLAIGGALGLVAGYRGGVTEKMILAVADTFIVVPSLPMLILLSALVKKQMNMIVLGFIIASLTWGMPVRNVRSMILSLRERDFTHTAVFSGFSALNIMMSEYTPHILPWVAASFISRINMTIGMEVTLAIFGLSSLGEATLGTMIYWALQYSSMLRGLWWWIAAPVGAVVFIVLGFYMLSGGLAEYLNPRTRLYRVVTSEKEEENLSLDNV
jgi:peptide/nickel transport system permease protein